MLKDFPELLIALHKDRNKRGLASSPGSAPVKFDVHKPVGQCCGAGAALFGRSRDKRGGSGSSYI